MQQTINDASIQAGQSVTLTADTEWTLDGFVYVEDGAVLTIEPGTVIKGLKSPTTGDLTSALIISRGGKIMADGTADAPIIMTGAADDLSITSDLGPTDNQEWGGLIVLGKAFVGENGGEDVIEGLPSDDIRALYGQGLNDPINDDNSGIIRYVSVRHGGAVLGADNEINGVTLGGVGNGTTLEYVEVFANKDDGFEFFGGSVNGKYLTVANVGDDSFDFDESYSGSLQFIFSLQQDANNGIGDHAVEYDGTEDNTVGAPQFTGKIYNATFIGSDLDGSKSDGVRLIKNAALQMWNSIIMDIPGYTFRNGEPLDDGSGFENPALLDSVAFAANIAFNADNLVDGLDAPGTWADLVNNNTTVVDPALAGVSRTAGSNMLDPRPNAGSPALSGALVPGDDFSTPVNYRGAFNNRNNWLEGWTALSDYGFLGDLVTEASNVITDDAIQAGGSLVLDNSQEWILMVLYTLKMVLPLLLILVP